jgi:hypothetical protein
MSSAEGNQAPQMLQSSGEQQVFDPRSQLMSDPGVGKRVRAK